MECSAYCALGREDVAYTVPSVKDRKIKHGLCSLDEETSTGKTEWANTEFMSIAIETDSRCTTIQTGDSVRSQISQGSCDVPVTALDTRDGKCTEWTQPHPHVTEATVGSSVYTTEKIFRSAQVLRQGNHVHGEHLPCGHGNREAVWSMRCWNRN